MLAAWSGEPFEHRGAVVRVTPTPATRPHPPLFIGGASLGAARRAARFGLPFLLDRHAPGLEETYLNACAEFGTYPMLLMPPAQPCFVDVAEDPDRERAVPAAHVLDADIGWRSLQLFVDKVAPELIVAD